MKTEVDSTICAVCEKEDMPIYVFCSNCKVFLCSECDFRKHCIAASLGKTNEDETPGTPLFTVGEGEDGNYLLTELTQECQGLESERKMERLPTTVIFQPEALRNSYQLTESCHENYSSPICFEAQSQRIDQDIQEKKPSSGKALSSAGGKRNDYDYNNTDFIHNGHKREAVCEECQTKESKDQTLVHCQDCVQNLCSTCDTNIHRTGKRKTHRRICRSSDQVLQFLPPADLAEQILNAPEQNKSKTKKRRHKRSKKAKSSIESNSMCSMDSSSAYQSTYGNEVDGTSAQPMQTYPGIDWAGQNQKTQPPPNVQPLYKNNQGNFNQQPPNNFRGQFDQGSEFGAGTQHSLQDFMLPTSSNPYEQQHTHTNMNFSQEQRVRQGSDISPLFDQQHFETEFNQKVSLQQTQDEMIPRPQLQRGRQQYPPQQPERTLRGPRPQQSFGPMNMRQEPMPDELVEDYPRQNKQKKQSPIRNAPTKQQQFAQNNINISSSEQQKITKSNEALAYMPNLQPILEKGETGAIKEQIIELQKVLFEESSQGVLLVAIDKIKATLSERLEQLKLNGPSVYEVLEKASSLGVIHKTIRNFANTKNLTFISLRIEVLSRQCLSWVLASLRRDQMTPIESAVKNRIKEAYAFKVSTSNWESIVNYIRNQSQMAQSLKNWHMNLEKANHDDIVHYVPLFKKSSIYNSSIGETGDNPDISCLSEAEPQETEIALQASVLKPGDPTKEKHDKDYTFKIVEITEQLQIALQSSKNSAENDSIVKSLNTSNELSAKQFVSGVSTFAIYLQAEQEWIGVDQTTEGIDPELFGLLKNFLEKYFCENSPEEHVTQLDRGQQELETKWNSSLQNALTNKQSPDQTAQENEDKDETIRVIPGGRYGCSQFVKICGPQRLMNESIGSISQMVQLAIDEDILRYHKTLLVWTLKVDKHKVAASHDKKQMNTSLNSSGSQLKEQSFTSQKSAQEENSVDANKRQNAIDNKLTCVKECLEEILTESKIGMSLAQLPMHLNKKLPFNLDLNELGFPKLKDLIIAMRDKISLELRGTNHPFAYLKHQQEEIDRQGQRGLNMSAEQVLPQYQGPTNVRQINKQNSSHDKIPQQMSQNSSGHNPQSYRPHKATSSQSGSQSNSFNSEKWLPPNVSVDLPNLPQNQFDQRQPQYAQQKAVQAQMSGHYLPKSPEEAHRIQETVWAVISLVKQSPIGVHSADLCRKISFQIGYQFDPQDFHQPSIMSFVQNYVLVGNNFEHQQRVGTQDIQFVPQGSNFILRSRSYFQYLKTQQETEARQNQMQYPNPNPGVGPGPNHNFGMHSNIKDNMNQPHVNAPAFSPQYGQQFQGQQPPYNANVHHQAFSNQAGSGEQNGGHYGTNYQNQMNSGAFHPGAQVAPSMRRPQPQPQQQQQYYQGQNNEQYQNSQNFTPPQSQQQPPPGNFYPNPQNQQQPNSFMTESLGEFISQDRDHGTHEAAEEFNVDVDGTDQSQGPGLYNKLNVPGAGFPEDPNTIYKSLFLPVGGGSDTPTAHQARQQEANQYAAQGVGAANNNFSQSQYAYNQMAGAGGSNGSDFSQRTRKDSGSFQQNPSNIDDLLNDD